MRAGYPDRIGSEDAAAAMAKGGAKKAAAAAARAAARMLADNPAHGTSTRSRNQTGIELVHRGGRSATAANLPMASPDPQWGVRHNVHIHPHHAGITNHDPLRTRKLLAHRHEIDKLRGLWIRKAYADPLNIHLKGSRSSSPSAWAKGASCTTSAPPKRKSNRRRT